MSRLEGDLFTSVGTWDYDGPEYFLRLNLDRGPWRFQSFATFLDLDAATFPTGLPVPPVPLADRLQSNTFDVEIQRELELGDHGLLFGLNTRRVVTDAPDLLGSRESETLYGAFFQDQYRIEDWVTAFLAARVDDHPKAGLNVSPRLSLLFKPHDKTRFWLAFSRAFRSPTQVLNYLDLTLSGFAPGPTPLATIDGNEDLDPSWATSYEAGFQAFPHPRLNLQGAVFYQVVEDQTQIVPTGPGLPVPQTFVNAGRVSVAGLETWLEYRHSDTLRGFASYTFQAAHGEYQFSTPSHRAALGLRGRLHPRVRYALTGMYVDHVEYQDTPPALPVDDIPSRFQLDGFVGFQLTSWFELGFRARNVLHQVRPQFPVGDEIGSEWFVTGRFEF
jgi:outer membrane receptor protein involved in Fe transport